MTARRPGSADASWARVPVGRRFLVSDRRRAVLTVLGVAASLLLVLLLGGIVAGAVERVTQYIRTSEADLFISQQGVRTMHMSVSDLPAEAVSEVAGVPGVRWAAPIGFSSGSVAGPGGRMLTYLIGYDVETTHGGPRLAAGRAPGMGEAVMDEQAADILGVGLGDEATILGSVLRVVGMSTAGTSITNTTVYVSRQQFAALRGDRVSYILVRAVPDADRDQLAEAVRLALPGTTVQTREQFAESEARVVRDMSADLLTLMSTLGLVIALAVIALGLMSATLARLRDFAVLKALGCSTRRLVGAVIAQVLWTVGVAAASAAAVAALLGWLVPMVAPTVQIRVSGPDAARAAAEALVIGIAAALLPLHRIASIDAASAFRETR